MPIHLVHIHDVPALFDSSKKLVAGLPGNYQLLEAIGEGVVGFLNPETGKHYRLNWSPHYSPSGMVFISDGKRYSEQLSQVDQ